MNCIFIELLIANKTNTKYIVSTIIYLVREKKICIFYMCLCVD